MNKASKCYMVWRFLPTKTDKFPTLLWPHKPAPRGDDILAMTNLIRVRKNLLKLVQPPEGTLERVEMAGPRPDCPLVPRRRHGPLGYWWAYIVYAYQHVPPLAGWCKDHGDMQRQWLDHAAKFYWAHADAPFTTWRRRIAVLNARTTQPKPTKYHPFNIVQGPAYFSELRYAVVDGWRSRIYHKSVVRQNALIEFNEHFGTSVTVLPKFTVFKSDNSLTALRQYSKYSSEPQPDTEQ